MAKVRNGKCHVCGEVGPLSFEHVPPRAAFNNRPVRIVANDIALRADPDNLPKGRQQQRGAGAYTLCERCNNDTGSWYGDAFAMFAWEAALILSATRGQASLYYTFRIFPQRVLKQLVCMFLSINGAGFSDGHPELTRFVLNKWSIGLPPKYRFYAYFNASGRARNIGGAAMLNLGGPVRVLSELAFPPLGYVMCLTGPPPDDRLVEITHFSRYLYDDFRHLPLRLPVLPIFTLFPGDYRDRETVLREARNQSDGV